MNKYESIIIITTKITDEEIKNIINEMAELKKKIGKLENIEELGKKRLAYTIKNNTEGYYVLFEFETKPENIAEIERNYRITEEIIKFITVKKY